MSAPSFEKSLQDIVGSQNVRPDEPLVEHTTFRIGGPAQWLVTPRSEDEVAGVVSTCEAAGIPWRVLGFGSNVLAPDEGLDGVTLLLADNFAANAELLGRWPIGIAHAGCRDEALALAAMLKESDPKARIILVDYEPVTGSHVGPGALAMFYVAKEPWSSAIC